MPNPLRIGVIGLTHDHVWDNLPHLMATEGTELVAAADPNGPLLERVQREYGAAVYQDHEEMVRGESLDAVYVYTDNRRSAELAAWSAERGLHVLIEKPLAADLAGAEAVVDAAKRSGARLMVNWPFAWWPQLQTAVDMALDGRLGRIWQVKYRAAHAGPEEVGCSKYFCDWLFDPEKNGGGALMDYCCYGANLAVTLLGMPQRVTGVTGRLVKEPIRVEDNALVVMSYPRAVAVAEASWTQVGKLTGYITAIYGDRATLMVEPRAGGRLWMATADEPQGVVVELPEQDPHLVNSAAHFAWGVSTGNEVQRLCRADGCRDAQAILQAALASADSGAAVPLA